MRRLITRFLLSMRFVPRYRTGAGYQVSRIGESRRPRHGCCDTGGSMNFRRIRPFFCQIEAIETLIWLTEVAHRQKRHKHLWTHIENANEQANPELLRLALKMATGAGKTTVMAMLIAWQTVNAVRTPGSKLFTRGFLIITPGITIRDRLRVLHPNDPESYFKSRELVPADMLQEVKKAKIVITNYHAFLTREIMETGRVGKALLQGRGEALNTRETEGQMIRRVADELMGLKNIVVINDEAHHCYREKPDNEELAKLKADEKREATEENKAARVWLGGIEAFKRNLGVRAVYDLSATPFFLRGSGWAEGTLFPWTVSDFSLMDAIECGIVKLPRVPVSDNIPTEAMPVFRDLWQHISADEQPKLYLFGQVRRIARQWLDGGYLECRGNTGRWMLEYRNIADQAAERIRNAITDAMSDKKQIQAVLDPYNPTSSTAHVNFSTSKDLYTTAPARSHVNYVALDSAWEAEFARVLEQHPRVISYIKNQGLGFEVPYKDGSTARVYLPDFIVLIDDGNGPDDPLHLIVEIKGYRHENVKLKSETIRTQWLVGVNNLGRCGRWDFAELSDLYAMESDLTEKIEEKFGKIVEQQISG